MVYILFILWTWVIFQNYSLFDVYNPNSKSLVSFFFSFFQVMQEKKIIILFVTRKKKEKYSHSCFHIALNLKIEMNRLLKMLCRNQKKKTSIVWTILKIITTWDDQHYPKRILFLDNMHLKKVKECIIHNGQNSKDEVTISVLFCF